MVRPSSRTCDALALDRHGGEAVPTVRGVRGRVHRRAGGRLRGRAGQGSGEDRVTFASLSEAIEWAEARWSGQRPAPIRLHLAHSTEGALGAPAFTHSFAAALDGFVNETSAATQTVHCYHPMLLIGKSLRDCPECWGVGVKDVNVDRFRYPMTRALSRLANSLRSRVDRMPHPYLTVMTLAEHGWDAHATARSLDLPWEVAEAQCLRS